MDNYYHVDVNKNGKGWADVKARHAVTYVWQIMMVSIDWREILYLTWYTLPEIKLLYCGFDDKHAQFHNDLVATHIIYTTEHPNKTRSTHAKQPDQTT